MHFGEKLATLYLVTKNEGAIYRQYFLEKGSIVVGNFGAISLIPIFLKGKILFASLSSFEENNLLMDCKLSREGSC